MAERNDTEDVIQATNSLFGSFNDFDWRFIRSAFKGILGWVIQNRIPNHQRLCWSHETQWTGD